MKKLLVVIGIILGTGIGFGQSRGTPSNLRIRVDANGSLFVASAVQVNPVTSVQFNNARLAVDASGNLLVVGGGSFDTICGDTSNEQVLFNDNDACAGSNDFTWDGEALFVGDFVVDTSANTVELPRVDSNLDMRNNKHIRFDDSGNSVVAEIYLGQFLLASDDLIVGTGEFNNYLQLGAAVAVLPAQTATVFGNLTLPWNGVTSNSYTVTDGNAFKTDTTTGHTGCFSSVYDVDNTTYRCFITGTNGDTPVVQIYKPTGGTLQGDFDNLALGGTSVAILGANVFTGAQDIAAAGVRFSAAAGVLTEAGLSGTTENLTWDFSSANLVTVATGTGVTKIDFGTLILEAAFNSADGTAGLTQTCASAVIALTIKNGLVTAATCP